MSRSRLRAPRCAFDAASPAHPSQYAAYQQYFDAVLAASRRAWVQFDESTIVTGLLAMAALLIGATRALHRSPGAVTCTSTTAHPGAGFRSVGSVAGGLVLLLTAAGGGSVYYTQHEVRLVHPARRAQRRCRRCSPASPLRCCWRCWSSKRGAVCAAARLASTGMPHRSAGPAHGRPTGCCRGNCGESGAQLWVSVCGVQRWPELVQCDMPSRRA